MVSSVPVTEKLLIGGELNGHVGTTNIWFEGVHGDFRYGDGNQEGRDILDFAIAYNLLVANTFSKRQSHLVTFSSAQHSSQIDFVLTRRMDRWACLNCKVTLGSVLWRNISLW